MNFDYRSIELFNLERTTLKLDDNNNAEKCRIIVNSPIKALKALKFKQMYYNNEHLNKIFFKYPIRSPKAIYPLKIQFLNYSQIRIIPYSNLLKNDTHICLLFKKI